jgi:spore germination cell wall hydrolase CwlJ-like protein
MIEALILEAPLPVEMKCATRIAYFEARSLGFHGMITVLAVAKNRVLDDRFPDTFCAVETQPHQWEYYHKFRSGAYRLSEKGAREQARHAAYAVLTSTNSPMLKNVLLYHGDHIKPDWDYSKLTEEFRFENHIFYSYEE